MRILMLILLGTGLAATTAVRASEPAPATQAPAADPAATTRAPAADPAAATEDCLNNKDIRAKRLSAEQGYLAQTRTGWWRNTGAACPAFAKNRALVTRSTSNRQCTGDVVEVVDPFSRISYGGCTLGNWQRIAAPSATAGK